MLEVSFFKDVSTRSTLDLHLKVKRTDPSNSDGVVKGRQTYIRTYFIYLSTVKSSVLHYKKKVLKTSQVKIKILFYKIAVWDPDWQLLQSRPIFLLKRPREFIFHKLTGRLFHNSAPL